MTEKPIIMSGPMVRAYLAGRKTQTRRIMKPQPEQRENAALPGHVGTWFHSWNLDHEAVDISDIIQYCPYGDVGGSIWWRETWRYGTTGISYRASASHEVLRMGYKWKPSIHMPRKYCRIVTPLTRVRIQRLQDMTAADAQHEGCGFGSSGYSKYIDLWNSLNEKRGFGWDTNPWVWVIEFEKVETNE